MAKVVKKQVKPKAVEKEEVEINEKEPADNPVNVVSNAIKEAQTESDLLKAEQLAIQLFGDKIPDELNELANEKNEEINQKEADKAEKGWVVLTAEQRIQAEKEGKLAGYNIRTGACLLS